MRPDHSDLEAVPQRDFSGLQAVTVDKYAHSDGLVALHHQPDSRDPISNLEHAPEKEHTPTPRRLCGLKPVLLFVLIGVIVAVAIGAGVGGGLAARRARQTDTTANAIATAIAFTSESATEGLGSATTQRAPSTPPPSSTSKLAVTATQIVGPTYTLTRDCPSSNNTMYNITSGSSTTSFRKLCAQAIYGDLPYLLNQAANSLDDCIDLCSAYNVANANKIREGGKVCNAVAWSYTGPDIDPGYCGGYQWMLNNGDLVKPGETRLDSAFWDNQF